MTYCFHVHESGSVPATGRVRRAGELGRPAQLSDPVCDEHQVIIAQRWRTEGARDVYAVPLAPLPESERERLAARFQSQGLDEEAASYLAEDVIRGVVSLVESERSTRASRITDAMVEAFGAAAQECGGELAIGARQVRAGLTAAMIRRDLDKATTPEPYPASVSEVADEIARYVLELETSGAARGVATELVARLSVRAVVRARGGPENPLPDAPEIGTVADLYRYRQD